MRLLSLSIFFLCGLGLLRVMEAFNFFGSQPEDYREGQQIDLYVNRMTSPRTQLSLDYYSLPFCQPFEITKKPGLDLFGGSAKNSLYEIFALRNETCKVLCEMEYDVASIEQFKRRMNEEYRIYWTFDDLPGGRSFKWGRGSTSYQAGFPLGIRLSEYYLYNHVDIKLLFHREDNDHIRIVGFEVLPQSVGQPEGSLHPTCSNATSFDRRAFPLYNESKKGVWTYSVTWEESSILWEQRWDRYTPPGDNTDILLFSIINSVLIAFFLGGIIFMMLKRFRADVAWHNSSDDWDQLALSGWMSVADEVFRPPHHPLMLSVLVGSGVQVLGVTFLTIVFGLLSTPAVQGNLLNVSFVLAILMGLFAGYSSTRNYRMINGQSFAKVTIYTALFLPGVIFSIFIIVNIFLINSDHDISAEAMSFGSMISLAAIWLGITAPLVSFGSSSAMDKPISFIHAHRYRRIAASPCRPIPRRPWYMHPVTISSIQGLFPFAAVFIQNFVVLSSVWGGQLIQTYGVLLVTFIVQVIICSGVAFITCFLQFNGEDYRWWWQPFYTAGASAFYMMLYSIFYFYTKLWIDRLESIVLYFGCTFIMLFAYFVMTGTVGYYASLFTIRKLYRLFYVD